MHSSYHCNKCKSNNCMIHCRKIKKSATTLDVTIIGQDNPTKGTKGEYFKLKYGKGDRTLVREELAYGKRNRRKHRIPLAAFIQITDVHIIDAASPARAAFLAQYIPEEPELADSFRPQEALSMQVADAMVRKINSIKVGPKTGKEIGFVISCGDNGDGQQKNELQNYINVLDGTTVIPNPATPGKYVGVQDNVPTVNFEAYYHPDIPPGPDFVDLYKTEYGFPEYPNILNIAACPFKARGLIYPWYTANGNHDCTKLGNYGLGDFSMLKLLNQLGTGTLPDGLGSKMIEAMDPAQAKLFVKALEAQNAEATLDVIKSSILRDIPRSSKRLLYTGADFIAMHFNTTEYPGPLGHGFTEQNRINNTLYYSMKVSECIDGFVLDTCNPSGNLEDPSLAPNGSIGRIQLSWLEGELIKRHSKYYNTQGQLVLTKYTDTLCVLFSHHNHNTMNNIYNELDTSDLDPQKIAGPEFIKTIQRFPNVILWVNGHTHRNIITPLHTAKCITIGKEKCKNVKSRHKFHHKHHNKQYKGPSKKSGYNGFWEINTASHIDFPQQSRIIEIADNQDGTLSIFGTLIDHLSPPIVNAMGPRYTITEMASISRELSFNDPFNDPKTRGGLPKDRNVELLINNPIWRH